jgi:Fibronectin type III domain/Calcineurin-like phosphoesterase
MIRTPKPRRPEIRGSYRPWLEALEDRLPPTTFAVIGDYGAGSTSAESNIAATVHTWQPDFVATVGNNNSPVGAAATIDANVGQYYHDFIFPYKGQYGAAAPSNRFWPSLGHQDWGNAYPNPTGDRPYLNYFTLPNNGRYYTFTQGPVQLFALDSDPNEPDGNTSSSVQAQWLKSQLAASTATWKIVYFQHAPYSSGTHYGSAAGMQWPFQAWGATAVIAGHDRDYERVVESNFPYFVVGTGGATLDSFGPPVAGSQVRYNGDWGALRVDAGASQLTFQFITRLGQVIDRYTLYTVPENYLPEAPSNLTAAAASTTQINLAWTDNSSNEDGFQIERSTDDEANFTPVATVGPNVTTYQDTGLAAGIQYYYQVAALNAAGVSPLSNVATDSTAAPQAPVNLKASAVSLSVINLAWTDGSGNATAFKIERSTNGVIFSQIASVGAGNTSYTDTGLAASRSYVYRLRATNGVGDSPYSLTARATTTAHTQLVTNANIVFSVPVNSKPGYLKPFTDPTFGSRITRIAGDPGASLTAADGSSGTWSRYARHHYYQDQPWNADGSLLVIQNESQGGGSPNQLYLDGNTYQVLFGTPSNMPYGGAGDDRWLPSPAHKNERVVAGYPGTTLYWFDVRANTVTRSWNLPFAVRGIDRGYGNTAFDGRYVFLHEKADASGNMRGFVVDMDPQSPYPAYPNQRIGPVYNFNDGGGPAGVSLAGAWASISPSGKYVVLHYEGDYERVYDVDPTTLALTPHAMPVAWPGQAGTAAQGFIYNVGEPDMTLNPFDNNEDVIVGEEHSGNVGKNIAGIQTVNTDGIGHVVMVRLRDNAVFSLTDPGNGASIPDEAYAYHVSARAFNRPGWVYVGYYPSTDPGGDRYSEEIVAVKMDGSGSVERFAHYHSNFDGVYPAEAHAVPSPDGKRVLFASNWEFNGNGLLNSVQDYVVDTRQAVSFAVTGLPTSIVAGVPLSFTVTARDVYGDAATGYRGTVHFTSSDSHALLPADYTFTAADSGVRTFTATLQTAGYQWLKETDIAASSLFGVESNLKVQAAAASMLLVAGFPPSVTAGVSGVFTVTAVDPYGNRASSYRGTVHFSSSDPQAVLPLDYTFTAADYGRHAFRAILKTSGTQTLTVTDTAQATVTGSEKVAVVPAVASRFSVTAPAQVTAGAAFSVVITALDLYGNVATGYTGMIHFSSSDNLAILPANYLFTSGPGLDNGVHTFTVTLNTTGSQSLTVTDTAHPAITGSQTGIMVAAASLDRLWKTEPVDAAAADGLFDLIPEMHAAQELSALLAESEAQPGHLHVAVLSVAESCLPEHTEAAVQDLVALLAPHLPMSDLPADEAPESLTCIFSSVAALYLGAHPLSREPIVSRKHRQVAPLWAQA